LEGTPVDLERLKPDVKQAIIWTREAWNVGVESKTIANCWRKTGILPKSDVEVVGDSLSSVDALAQLAALLTEFVTDTLPDIMNAQELLDVDGEVPTEAPEVEADATPAEDSSDEEEQPAPAPVSLREARAFMAKVAEFIQVNSATRGLARFVDVSMEIQSELDATIVTASHKQAAVTAFFKPVPKIATFPSP
jgi:hypothetical protein